MKIKFVLFQVLMIASFMGILASAGLSQTKPEVITNAQIIQMVRMGLGQDLIVEKIHQSECRCDTSTDAMAKLKAAKVSDPIIMAMLESSRNFSETPPVNKPEAEKRPVAKVPEEKDSAGPRQLREIAEPGIYLFEDGKMTAIEPSVFSGSSMNPLKASMTLGIKKIKYKVKVRGRSANMRTVVSRPVFYFVFNPDIKNSGLTMAGYWGVATSPAEFMMVQMDIQQNSRQAVLGEASAFTGSVSMGARDKDIREYAFEKVKPGVYKVVPKVDLLAGEYSFYYAGTMTGFGFAGGKVFDFGVGK